MICAPAKAGTRNGNEPPVRLGLLPSQKHDVHVLRTRSRCKPGDPQRPPRRASAAPGPVTPASRTMGTTLLPYPRPRLRRAISQMPLRPAQPCSNDTPPCSCEGRSLGRTGSPLPLLHVPRSNDTTAPSLGTSGTDHRPVPTTGDPLGNLEPPFHREPPSPKIADHLPPPAPNMTARARPPTRKTGAAHPAPPPLMLAHIRSRRLRPPWRGTGACARSNPASACAGGSSWASPRPSRHRRYRRWPAPATFSTAG